jgi:hypothetical protein
MEMSLRLPMEYVEVERDEMEYVDGAGTITITLTKGTIQKAIGTISGTVTKFAVTAALDALGASIATAVELGTAGAGTLVVGAFLIAWGGMASALAGSIVGAVVGHTYTGGSQSASFNVPLVPSHTFTF